LDDQAMRDKLAWCLSAPAREQAARCAANGRRRLDKVHDDLIRLLYSYWS
jgi:hypothetical protein